MRWDPKKCALCNKPALYIRPPEGRCREHRDTPTRASLLATARHEARSDARMIRELDMDRVLLKRRETAANRRGGSLGRIGAK